MNEQVKIKEMEAKIDILSRNLSLEKELSSTYKELTLIQKQRIEQMKEDEKKVFFNNKPSLN